ncbi:CCR4-NOT transcription complex subunit 3 [Tanacetum coccineum]
MEAIQGDINHVPKRVQDDIDVFDTLWKKIYNSDNGNHTENNQNIEADLKKEIKKLQRYREEMKTWIQSNAIKDKKVILFILLTIDDANSSYKSVKLIEAKVKKSQSQTSVTN